MVAERDALERASASRENEADALQRALDLAAAFLEDTGDNASYTAKRRVMEHVGLVVKLEWRDGRRGLWLDSDLPVPGEWLPLE
jgi:hypothetical protein